MSDALLIGGTGLVGSLVRKRWHDGTLTALARRGGAGLEAAEPADWPARITAHAPAIFLSTLGTTIRAAGSQDAFVAVDRDLLLASAGAARRAGAGHCIMVSSVGASARSRNFYLKTKGETEDGLRALGFDRLDIIRPGLIVGARTERRALERIAQVAAPLSDALLWGGLRRYRSIPAATIADAIVNLAARGGEGTHIHHFDALRALAGARVD